MSKEQVTPTIVVNQPSLDQIEESPRNKLRASIGRSNSAPQSDNKFSISRMGLKSKDSPSQERSTSNQSNHMEGIPTLYDGVILASQDQMNISMSSDSSSISSLSQTPLCEKFIQQEPKPGDVWQRREHFVSSGRTDNIDSKMTNENKTSELQQFPNNNNNDACDKYHISSDVRQEPVLSSSEATPGDSPLRKSPARRPFRQAQSEVLPNEVQRKMSMADMNQKGYVKLEEELNKAQRALALKDEEVDELRGIRERLMKEVSDFTASLFEEVNSQLNEAALNEQQSKKQLQEANCKIEMLSAEVAALKDLVLTSTPSSPNKHLHPQIDTQPTKKEKGGKPFWKTHRRSTSHHQFTQEAREMAEAKQSHSELKEMDTVVFDEFSRWRLQPSLDFSSHFLSRIQQEDIQPCLNFRNTQLSERLRECVQNNTLSIEPIPGDSSFPRKCCLSETHKLCNYKIRLEGNDEWYSISPMCRNRITAVCDFFTYVRYIVQGLVKSSEKDMFVQLVKLRHQMARARLGLI